MIEVTKRAKKALLAKKLAARAGRRRLSMHLTERPDHGVKQLRSDHGSTKLRSA